MRRIVTNAQMKALDAYTIKEIGMASMLLMERAALAVVEVLKDGRFDLSRILIICGTGNNGGDGIAIGRLLGLAGIGTDVYLTGNTEKTSEEYKIQKNIAEKYGTTFVNKLDMSEYTTIVDSVFGVGLSRNLSDTYQQLFHQINESSAQVLAVDIPSGIHGDTGLIMGEAIKADVTVTFAYPKPGLFLYPGADYAGTVIVKDIGIYDYDVLSTPSIWQIEANDQKLLPRRFAYSNKSSFGKVFLVAGSDNMSGAAYLSAKACLRTGAGMVKIHTVEANRVILQQQLPEAMLSTYGEHVNEAKLDSGMNWSDIIGIGPGMGSSLQALSILTYILQHTRKPIVIDADGLNLLSQQMDLLKQHQGPVIVTPHLGEMSRLIGQSIDDISQNLMTEASRLAQEYGVTCVLKDTRTIVALPDGQLFINTSGNNGMATAGSGDVLTGIVAGLLAQYVKGDDSGIKIAAPLGVYLHGRAGDEARKLLGERAMMAGDLIEQLPAVLRQNI